MGAEKSRLLGIDFFRGSLGDAVEKANEGGLCVAPSGPGLAGDLTTCSAYSDSLALADLVLPDSGLMCLWSKLFSGEPIKRISGLAFLKAYLLDNDFSSGRDALWVMPDERQGANNRKWLRDELGLEFGDEAFYVAPRYARSGPLEDADLLAAINELKPRTIFVQLGGGVQERLGFFIRDKISHAATILCTGAALAFLSGEQVRIPDWADRLYLGWFLRCCAQPSIFVPRYLKAFRLIGVLAKYGGTLPEVSEVRTWRS